MPFSNIFLQNGVVTCVVCYELELIEKSPLRNADSLSVCEDILFLRYHQTECFDQTSTIH